MSNLLLRRRMLMQAGGSPTPPQPYDAEVEYLEFDTTNWINTAQYITSATGVKLDLEITNYPSWSLYYPLFAFYLGMTYGWWIQNEYAKIAVWRNGENYGSPIYIGYARHAFDSYHGLFTIDGNTFYHDTNAYTANASVPFNICAYTTGVNTVDNRHAGMKLHGCELYGDINIAYKMVRCGTVGYLYDPVNDHLYGAAGGNNINPGPDIN